MVHTDPYRPTGARRYECRSCLAVVVAEERVSRCPDCGAGMANRSVPQE